MALTVSGHKCQHYSDSGHPRATSRSRAGARAARARALGFDAGLHHHPAATAQARGGLPRGASATDAGQL